MSRVTSQYPERVYSSSEEGEHRRLLERENVRRPGLLLAGLACARLGHMGGVLFWPRLEALPANSCM